MTISKITQNIVDGALGLAQDLGTDRHIAVGVASSGPQNIVKWHTDPVAVKAEFGTGPLVDKAVYHLEATGGVVGVLRLTSSVAGTLGAVTVTRGGAADSTATATASGVPLDAYQIRVKITREGATLAANTAAFVYALDGGDVYSAEIAMPVSGIYAIPNTGVTLTFVNGVGTAFKVDDVHALDCVAPGFSATDLNTALDAIKADASAKFRLIHVVGAAATAAASATIAAAAAVKMAAEEANYRYTYLWLEAADDTDANLKTSFVNFVSGRVNVVAGYCELLANGKQMKRSFAWPAAARRMAQTPNRDLARTAPDKQGGALPGVVRLYRDEYLTPGLDDARFTTGRTYPGQAGFFVANGRTMAAVGSDFQLLQHRELMDVACAENYAALFPYLNDDTFAVDRDTGYIDELDARRVESKVNAKLATRLVSPKWVSEVASTITRDNNMLSTNTLKTRVRIVPRPYAKSIESEIGFYNPALNPSA